MEHDAIPDQPQAQPSASTLSRDVTDRIKQPGGQDAGIFAQFRNNPFFTAGFGLAALGTGLAIAQKTVRQGAALLRRRLLVDIEITRHDESYQWFLHWMSHYQRAQLLGSQTASPTSGAWDRLLRSITPRMHHLSMQTTSARTASGQSHTFFSLVPGPGRHILRYGRAFIAVSREREKGPLDVTGKPFETVTLTTLYSHRHVFEELFKEAHLLSLRAQEGKTTILTMWQSDWKQFGEAKRKRPLDSVVLAEGVKDQILQDIRAFMSNREWYLDRGIPYRRGYLLHGPPGTGKSSFIQALAGELDLNIAMLSLSERGLTDDRLMHMLMKVPPRTIVLLEDADAAFSNRRSQTDDDGYRGANVTYSGLLNALDGVASAEERIVFLTTNFIERLDEALIRPGRVDLTIRLGEATDWQIARLWDRFFSDDDPEGKFRAIFLEKVRDLGLVGKVSTATLQGLFLFNKDDPQGAIVMVNSLLPEKQLAKAATMQTADG